MQIEKHLQPNCSELVMMISGRRDKGMIEDVVTRVRNLKLDIGLGDWDGQKITKLSSKAVALLMKTVDESEDNTLTNVDKLQFVGELRKQGMAESDIKQFLKDVEADISLYILDGKGDVNFRLSDGYGGEGICVMTGDCEQTSFPILKKLQEEFDGEVYPVDGGHMDNWEEFNAKEDKDE